MPCEITSDTLGLTHTALQSEASPLRADGGCAGEAPPGRVPISAQAAIDHAAEMPSLQPDGPGDESPAAGVPARDTL